MEIFCDFRLSGLDARELDLEVVCLGFFVVGECKGEKNMIEIRKKKL